MRVPQKVDYALRAMLELAASVAPGESIRSADIAGRAGVPEKYLEAILVELGRAGLIASRRGPDGGHRLSRSPAAITVTEIYAAVDGTLELAPGRQVQRRGEVSAGEATVAALWRSVEEAIQGVLSRTTLEDLRRRVESERNVLDFII